MSALATGNVATTSRTVDQMLRRSDSLLRIDGWIHAERTLRKAKRNAKKAEEGYWKKQAQSILESAKRRAASCKRALRREDFLELEALMESAYAAGIPEDGDKYVKLLSKMAKVLELVLSPKDLEVYRRRQECIDLRNLKKKFVQ